MIFQFSHAQFWVMTPFNKRRKKIAKIDYSKEMLDILNIKISFYTSKFIIEPAHFKTLFFVCIGNPHVTKGYLPKIIISEGIELRDNRLTENINGKVYTDVINSLDMKI